MKGIFWVVASALLWDFLRRLAGRWLFVHDWSVYHDGWSDAARIYAG